MYVQAGTEPCEVCDGSGCYVGVPFPIAVAVDRKTTVAGIYHDGRGGGGGGTVAPSG